MILELSPNNEIFQKDLQPTLSIDNIDFEGVNLSNITYRFYLDISEFETAYEINETNNETLTAPLAVEKTYSVDSLSENYKLIYEGPNQSYKISNYTLTEGETYKWYCEVLSDGSLINTSSVKSFSINNHVTITINNGNPSLGTVTNGGSNELEMYTSFNAMATSNPNGEFIGWYDSFNNIYSSDPNLSIVSVDKDLELTAKFEILYNIHIDNLDPGLGTVVDEGDNYIKEKGSFTLNASSDIGGRFLGWYKDGELLSLKKECVLKNITSDAVYSADFVKKTNDYEATISGLYPIGKIIQHDLQPQFGIGNVDFGISSPTNVRYRFYLNTRMFDLEKNYNDVGLDLIQQSSVEDSVGQKTYTYGFEKPTDPYFELMYEGPNLEYILSKYELPVNENFEWYCEVIYDNNIVASSVETFYIKNNYTINIENANPSNGSIVNEGANVVLGNDSITLNATANTGYSFMNWKDSSGSIISEEPSYQILKVTKDETYTASFLKEHVITIVNDNPSLGSVSNEGENVFYGNTTFLLNATPNSDAKFLGWYKDNNLVTESANYPVPASTSIYVAKFAEFFTVNTNNTNPDLGSVLTPGPIDVLHGETTTIEASPVAGNRFLGWFVNGTLASNSLSYETDPINYDITYEARFSDSYEVTIINNNLDMGTVEDTGTIEVLSGDTLSLEADSFIDSTFEGWYVDGSLVSDAPNYKTAGITENKTYLAKFKKESITVTLTSGENGSVGSDRTINVGESVTIDATPNEGFAFKYWTYEDNTVAFYERTVTIENLFTDLNLTANFVSKENLTEDFYIYNIQTAKEIANQQISLANFDYIKKFQTKEIVKNLESPNVNVLLGENLVEETNLVTITDSDYSLSQENITETINGKNISKNIITKQFNIEDVILEKTKENGIENLTVDDSNAEISIDGVSYDGSRISLTDPNKGYALFKIPNNNYNDIVFNYNKISSNGSAKVYYGKSESTLIMYEELTTENPSGELVIKNLGDNNFIKIVLDDPNGTTNVDFNVSGNIIKEKYINDNPKGYMVYDNSLNKYINKVAPFQVDFSKNTKLKFIYDNHNTQSKIEKINYSLDLNQHFFGIFFEGSFINKKSETENTVTFQAPKKINTDEILEVICKVKKG